MRELAAQFLALAERKRSDWQARLSPMKTLVHGRRFVLRAVCERPAGPLPQMPTR